MDKKHIPEDEIEQRLKDHLRNEAEKHRAPADLWARLSPRLERPAPKKGPRSMWSGITAWYRARPLPALATALVLVLAVTGAWVVTASPWQQISPPASRPPAATAPTPTPAPGMRSSTEWSSPGYKDSGAATGVEGPVGGPGPMGPAGPAGDSGGTLPSVPYPYPTSAPMPTATPAPRPGVTPTPAPLPPGAIPPGSDAIPVDQSLIRMVIQNGTLSLVVENASQAMERITQLAKDMGGYVVSARTWQDGKRLAGAINIRVPAELFPDAMSAVRNVAIEVTQDEISSQDVTGEYVDLQSRLRNLQATEAQLLKIMDMATQVSDVLAVQSQLNDVQGEIEQTKGRMQYLEASSATSLVQVALREVGLDAAIAPSTRQPRLGEEIKFSPRVSGGFAPYSYLWDLGDGSTSLDEAPAHTYDRVGKFDISLTVTDDKGNTVQTTVKEMIAVSPMEVFFNASQTKGRVGDETRFSAQVAGGFPSFTYVWDFGDGLASTDETPAHAFGRAGKFDVTVTVTDDKANTATLTRKGFISVEAMEVAFNVSATEVEAGQEVYFKPQVYGGFTPYNYVWDLGDGSTSQDRDPSHVYQKAGRYTVSLTVTDDKGNVATESGKQLITVTAPPAWDAGQQMANAVDALSAIGQGLLTGLIWLVVLVPLWGVVIALVVAALARARRST